MEGTVFNVGDKVNVMDEDETYTTYPDFIFNPVARVQIKSVDLGYWKYDASIPPELTGRDTAWTVKYLCKHDEYEAMVAYIVNEEHGKGFIIGVEGIALAEKPVSERDNVVAWLTENKGEICGILEDVGVDADDIPVDIKNKITEESQEELVDDWFENCDDESLTYKVSRYACDVRDIIKSLVDEL